MVILHVKHSDTNQFLFDTRLDLPVETVITEMVELDNMRIKLDNLATYTEALIQHGPLKPEEHRGLQEGEDESVNQIPGHRRNPDQNHYRTGWAVPEDLGQRMLETTEAAKRLISKNLALSRTPIFINQLTEAFDLIKGAVMMAYPAYHGLPSWEPTMNLLENRGIENFINGENLRDPNQSTLWFAGKEIIRGKLLGQAIRANERSTLIVKLTKQGTGAPVREPLVTPEAQREMIAMYHKKQEEEKKMLAQDEDDYMNSQWADSKNLKRQLLGQKDVKWRA